MSHPNPSHDRENERTEDSKFAPRAHHKALISVSDNFNTKTLSRIKAPTSKERMTLDHSIQRHLQKRYKKEPNFRGKVNYQNHLTQRAHMRGEED